MNPWYGVGALFFAVLLIGSADLYKEASLATPHSQMASSTALAAVETFLGIPASALPDVKSGLEVTPKLKSLLEVYGSGPAELGARTKTSACRAAGPLPDSRCSPGTVFAAVATSTLCKTGYSRSVRSVSVKMKQQIYAAYGISYPQAKGSYELDHLIPLELGGNNDSANLFPEAAEPKPGFREKDLVENYLHDEVCAGLIDLAAAQMQIARDWAAVFETLTPSTLAALKRQVAAYGD